MIFKIRILLISLYFITFSIKAHMLPEQLIDFLKQHNHSISKNVSITLYNNIPSKKWLTCAYPKFVLLDIIKRSQLTNIKVICGKSYQFLQVELNVKGKYLVAAKDIKKGEKINSSDVSIKYGYLNKVPLDTCFRKRDMLNTISTKDIKKNEFITKSSFRPVWLIKLNQKVIITLKDSGFTIISAGKSTNNAYKGEQVIVELENGKKISGIAYDKNNVVVDV
ncbi:MAG: flagellar basal body P-ring formation chaperone FlgA [Buchnera aphidicola (Schlechtendalia peitan)]